MQAIKEKRIVAIMDLGRVNMLDIGKKMGMKNIGFIKRYPDAPEKNVKRPDKDIASLIYYKELEQR